MTEYQIENIYSGEVRPVFGYNWKDACRRSNLVSDEWIILLAEYVD